MASLEEEWLKGFNNQDELKKKLLQQWVDFFGDFLVFLRENSGIKEIIEEENEIMTVYQELWKNIEENQPKQQVLEALRMALEANYSSRPGYHLKKLEMGKVYELILRKKRGESDIFQFVEALSNLRFCGLATASETAARLFPDEGIFINQEIYHFFKIVALTPELKDFKLEDFKKAERYKENYQRVKRLYDAFKPKIVEVVPTLKDRLTNMIINRFVYEFHRTLVDKEELVTFVRFLIADKIGRHLWRTHSFFEMGQAEIKYENSIPIIYLQLQKEYRALDDLYNYKNWKELKEAVKRIKVRENDDEIPRYSLALLHFRGMNTYEHPSERYPLPYYTGLRIGDPIIMGGLGKTKKTLGIIISGYVREEGRRYLLFIDEREVSFSWGSPWFVYIVNKPTEVLNGFFGEGENAEDGFPTEYASSNIIFYGPPGTGKTYRALKIAKESGAPSEMITFHPTYDYTDFVEGIRPNLFSDNKIGYEVHDGILKRLAAKALNLALPEEVQLKKEEPKWAKVYERYKKLKETDGAIRMNWQNRVYLIIDEINRGDIPRIFGELITIVEEDKRLGGENELSVKLPFSQEEFGIPKNLIIVGTMNTADKSISHFDIALRRRFEFEYMGPDFDKVPGLDQNIKSRLQQLNEALAREVGREKQIGHAYFMENGKVVSDLEQVLNKKIFPLLEEYFYYDEERLKQFLSRLLPTSTDTDDLKGMLIAFVLGEHEKD